MNICNHFQKQNNIYLCLFVSPIRFPDSWTSTSIFLLVEFLLAMQPISVLFFLNFGIIFNYSIFFFLDSLVLQFYLLMWTVNSSCNTISTYSQDLIESDEDIIKEPISRNYRTLWPCFFTFYCLIMTGTESASIAKDKNRQSSLHR